MTPAVLLLAAALVRVVPSGTGRIGAWLVVGPYRAAAGDALAQSPEGVDEAALAPMAGEAVGPAYVPRAPAKGSRAAPAGKRPAWALTGGEGPVDMKAALGARDPEVVGYAGGVLRVAKGGRHYLLLGVDDGVRVSVDGRVVFTRDDPRALREDDDLVPLDLTAGEHTLVLKLHQRDGAWIFRARLVDATLGPPDGATLALPGTKDDDARALAARMVSASLDRGVHGGGYAPTLTVRFADGAPAGPPIAVRARVRPARDPSDATPFQPVGALPPGGELTVPLGALDASRLEAEPHVVELDAGRTLIFPFPARRATRDALAKAERALVAQAGTPRVPPSTLATLAYLRNRLARFGSRGDDDAEAQTADARELDDLADAMLQGQDYYAARTGPMRRAYVSRADGELHEVALYVPPSYRPGQRRTYPLVVALHGMNGAPMTMLRHFFGNDDPDRDTAWEDRHPGAFPELDAFVLAPSGHGNAMYRDLGEDDVLRVLDWAMAAYPVDPTHVTVTGPSMGGIGTAAIAFRYPDRFAAAAPLCGYHSYFVRLDIKGRLIRPWERPLAEGRSNVFWAWNGKDLPLYVVHGTLDTPEANSGVLIERYEELGYSVRHEHPALGHNVWQPTYANLEGARWLTSQARDLHPREVRLRTLDLRAASSAWVHIDELAAPGAWAEVEARVVGKDALDVRTTGAAALRFDRDPRLLDAAGPVTVKIDGARIAFARGSELAVHVGARGWEAGLPVHSAPFKRAGLSGPLRDVFHEPVLFVWGDDDPAQSRVNREVARAWAEVRPGAGVTVKYPVISDAEFLARGESLANERALFLVGNAKSNRVLRELEPDLPAKIDEHGVVLGAKRHTGADVGVAFVHPNPRRPDRYVVVVAGATALGTFRSLSLPELLPDFIVYDERVAPARGRILLGAGSVRAAGSFRNDWSLPPLHR